MQDSFGALFESPFFGQFISISGRLLRFLRILKSLTNFFRIGGDTLCVQEPPPLKKTADDAAPCIAVSGWVKTRRSAISGAFVRMSTQCPSLVTIERDCAQGWHRLLPLTCRPHVYISSAPGAKRRGALPVFWTPTIKALWVRAHKPLFQYTRTLHNASASR